MVFSGSQLAVQFMVSLEVRKPRIVAPCFPRASNRQGHSGANFGDELAKGK